MPSRFLPVTMALVGCNAFFGIESTKLADPPDADPCPMDQDCDGVIDSVDKCPTIGDAMQTDFDLDGIGDACDPCSFTFDPAADDDNDQVAPASDRCPALYDPMQLDADGDGVGDACDPAPTHDALRCFSDFTQVSNTSQSWTFGGPWTHQASVVIHFPADTGPFVLVARTSGLPATNLGLQTGLNLDVSDGTFTAGLAVGSLAGAPSLQCVLGRTADQPLELRILAGDGTPLATTPYAVSSVPIRITFTIAAAGGGTAVGCNAQSGTDAPVTVTATTAAAIDTAAALLTATSSHAVFDHLSVFDLGP